MCSRQRNYTAEVFIGQHTISTIYSVYKLHNQRFYEGHREGRGIAKKLVNNR